MKRILGTAIAAVLVVGAGLVAPTVATAVPSNVVTSSEFYQVAYGNSIDYVRSTFGTKGTITDRIDGPGTVDDYVSLEFPTYYDDGFVQVDFARRSSGTWYLTAKYASWGNSVTRTADKATSSEFDKVKQGNSIAYVRSTFGTAGTIMEYFDLPGTQGDGVVVEWPTESVDGWLQVYFTKSSSGVWKVDTRMASWGVATKRTADKATEPEFDQVKVGNSLDHARSTFGTAGTVVSQFDAPGSDADSLGVDWPTESETGYLSIEFVRSSSGGWKVGSRWAYWGVSATPTGDLATEAEFVSLRKKLVNGSTVPLDEARRVFGSGGTVVYRGDERGTEYDQLLVHWYTGTEGEDVLMNFSVSAGTWKAMTIDDIAGPWNDGARSRSSEAEESPDLTVPSEKESPSRPTWDLRNAG